LTCCQATGETCFTKAAVQKVLGHERLGTTAIYLNLTDLHVVEEYAQKW
jgi:integrase/recombinase XerD